MEITFQLLEQAKEINSCLKGIAQGLGIHVYI